MRFVPNYRISRTSTVGTHSWCQQENDFFFCSVPRLRVHCVFRGLITANHARVSSLLDEDVTLISTTSGTPSQYSHNLFVLVSHVNLVFDDVVLSRFLFPQVFAAASDGTDDHSCKICECDAGEIVRFSLPAFSAALRSAAHLFVNDEGLFGLFPSSHVNPFLVLRFDVCSCHLTPFE